MASDQPVLNPESLDQIRELNPEMGNTLVISVLQTYLESSSELIRKIGIAINNEDAESLRVAAHSLKSASASIGADSLSSLFKELEQCGSSAAFSQARVLQSDASQQYQQVVAEINKMINNS